MKALRTIAKRLTMGLVTAWAVLTAVFLLFTRTEDWVAQRIEGNIRMAMGGPDPEPQEVIEEEIEAALAEFAAERGTDRPLSEQYVDWMLNMVTFDWGTSWETTEPVFPYVMGATRRTAMYVLPSIVLAVTIGTLIGLYAAMRPESRVANSTRLCSYLLFAIPGFWIGGMVLSGVYGGVYEWHPILFDHVLPIAFVTMTLLGGYVSFSRAYSLEHTTAQFVKLTRAKGAHPLRVARHVARNAAIPLFAMLFTEALGLLVLVIFVIEVLFGIEGFGLLFFYAIDARDLPVLLGFTMVIIAVGILGNIVQDLSYTYLDPRVEADG